MSQSIDTYIDLEAQRNMRKAIAAVGGNEVFFMGITDSRQRVVAVKTLARGNQSQVAAHTGHAEQGNVIIHNHPGNDLTPSDADVELSAFFSSFGVGSYIIDNDVSSVYVLVEPYEKKKHIELDQHEVTKIFSTGGTLNKALSAYEFRPEQLNMAHAVTQCLNAQGVSLIEAGTGTGKSFAYLVPSILYALLNKERVVVSTNTINLQEQLMHKDIPFLQRALGRDFRATLVKGRGNYVCVRKVQAEMEQFELFPDDDEHETLKTIYEWSLKTRDGSLSDLNFVPQYDIWEKICSEGDNCLRVKCPFYKECFFHSSRREAAISEVLIVNHHILFADLALKLEVGDASEYVLLPPFRSAIIDEAHNIEEAATSFFSRKLSRYTIRRITNRLYNVRSSRKKKGLLLFLERRIDRKEREVKKYIDELRQTIVQSVVSIEDIFESFSEFFSIYFKTEDKRKDFIPLTIELVNSIEYRDVVADNIRALKVLMEKILEQLRALTKAVEKCVYKEKKYKQGDCATLQSLCMKLMELIFCADLFLKQECDDLVRWIECQRKKGGTVEALFRSAPIEIKDVLHKTLFSQCAHVVLTSATLSVEGNLKFIKDRLGLAYDPDSAIACSETILPSSFNYKQQVFLGIFDNMPSPTEPSFKEHLKKNVFKSLSVTGGKAFVLFTSYALLNGVAEELQAPLSVYGISLLKQGDTTRHKILNEFRENVPSVLFGTDSFWEGVDVEGESLSNVLITRLPFQVPNDPILEARSDRIKKHGGNPFLEYTVPQAVIKFRQGFGRLIRNKNDFGSVLIFDSRVIHKRYGVKFLNSLPDCTVTFGSTDSVLQGLENFYDDFLSE